MAHHSPAFAKNVIRKSLMALIDRELSNAEKEEVWRYFESQCAFCGAEIGKESRNGHMDHLNSKGLNHISNRVLSCAHCNGDHKLEKPWKEFLEKKIVRS